MIRMVFLGFALVTAATMLGAAGAPAFADKRIVFNTAKAFFDQPEIDLSLGAGATARL